MKSLGITTNTAIINAFAAICDAWKSQGIAAVSVKVVVTDVIDVKFSDGATASAAARIARSMKRSYPQMDACNFNGDRAKSITMYMIEA